MGFMKNIKSIFFLFALGMLACNPEVKTSGPSPAQIDEQQDSLIHELNHALIDVVSEDLFPPPVASRIYAYSNIAAYEACQLLNPELHTLAGRLNGLDTLNIKADGVEYWDVVALRSFCEVAKHLVYRDFMIDTLFQQQLAVLQNRYPNEAGIKQAITTGDQIASHIKKWADLDGYNTTRNMPRYESIDAPYAWQATAPTYGEALEPHWAKLRPFVMDSASQFRVDIPIAFSEKEGSEFYQAAMEIYEIVNKAAEAEVAVAVYWDCNPGPTLVDGHSMKVRKQNTPGGHWVGIHSILAQDTKQNLSQSAYIYAKLGVGIADAFIAAWDTKFAHHLLRPETYINRYIDKDWKPKLESPLFPEYTSAHSLVSAVAASVLSDAYGEVPFDDNTNVRFDLPSKKFTNVWEAADEAAQSRLLGGIHYVFGCENGFEQGKRLGQLVNDQLE
jgi:hypothetical protein